MVRRRQFVAGKLGGRGMSTGRGRSNISLGSAIAGGGVVVPDPPEFVDLEVLPITFLTDTGGTQNLAGSFTPTGAMAMHAHTEVYGTSEVDGGMSVGLTDGTNDLLHGCRAEDGQATTDCQHYKTNNYNYGVAFFREFGTTPQARAPITFGVDQSTIVWNSSNAPIDTVGAMLHIGGADVSTKSIIQSVVASPDVEVSLTGVGFAPDVAITLTGLHQAGSGLVLGDSVLGIGFAVRDGNQASCNFLSQNGLATSDLDAMISANYFVSSVTGAGAFRNLEVTSWDADGISVTPRGAAGYGHNNNIFYIKLADAADAAVLDDIQLPNSTGTQTYEVGFKPRLVILATNNLAAYDITITDAAGGGLTLSMMTADAQYCSSFMEENDVATSESSGLTTAKALKMVNPDGTTHTEADFIAFTDTGFTLDFTTTTSLRKAIALCFR